MKPYSVFLGIDPGGGEAAIKVIQDRLWQTEGQRLCLGGAAGTSGDAFPL